MYYLNILLGVQESIQFPISTAVTTNTQSLISADQHLSMSPSEWMYTYVHKLLQSYRCLVKCNVLGMF